VITRKQLLGSVHRTAPKLATPAQLDGFWDRYWWVFVKGYHALEFAVLLLLLAWAADWWRSKLWALWVACTAYAATDEFHQLFVSARGGRVTDVLIDAGGATAAALLVAWTRNRYRQRALLAA
jgi:VanZ family protein